MKINKAMMDFRNNMLHLGDSTVKIPSNNNSVSVSSEAHSISVHVVEDMEFPGHSVRLVMATLQEGSCDSAEWFTELRIDRDYC